MFYYLVPCLGDGSRHNPYCPDIPEGTRWVGGIGNDGNYLIVTDSELNGYAPITDLQTICENDGFAYEDVLKWSV